ncbi:MAG: hypothetical protein HY586_06420 [Candidatus Omnitrophica bacterium]|nr:hypothetical protein [Candidatus Omnitrophota bacterium]
MQSKLIIYLAKLPKDEKVEVRYELDPSALDMEFVDFQYQSKLDIQGFLEKSGALLTFDGAIQAKVKRVCARCLAEEVTGESEEFHLVFDIKDKTELEATNELREVMIFVHPLRFLCKESCKGLCANCGVNLNIESCKCDK